MIVQGSGTHAERRTGFWAAVLSATVLALSPSTDVQAQADKLIQYSHPARLVRLSDGRRMNVDCRGVGSPVVILEHGLGSATISWRAVHDEIAALTTTCAYDRAGFGFSDVGPLPRTVSHTSADLEEMLRSAHIRGPYVIVAHSTGALNARYFAMTHRDAVVGLVLVDPSVEDQEDVLGSLSSDYGRARVRNLEEVRECIGLAAAREIKIGSESFERCGQMANSAWPPPLRRVFMERSVSRGYLRTSLSEYESLAGATSRELRTHDPALGNIPLVVLTAETSAPAPIRAAWTQMHEWVAHLSANGRHIVVPKTGHTIQIEQPDVVVRAASSILETYEPTNSR